MTADVLTVVWQKSHEYGRAYVDRILDTSPMPVEVIQENRWPGWWCKMGLFDPAIPGDLFYIDLDTIIAGDITELAHAGRTTMLRDFFFPDRPASGVMYLSRDDRRKVWEVWNKSPAKWMQKFAGVAKGGDGAFLATILKPRFWQDDFPGRICSFKVDCQDEPPPNASLICYHGHPRPHQTRWAKGGCSKWRKGFPTSALRCPR